MVPTSEGVARATILEKSPNPDIVVSDTSEVRTGFSVYDRGAVGKCSPTSPVLTRWLRLEDVKKVGLFPNVFG